MFGLVVEPKTWDVPRGAYVATGLQLSPKIPPNTTHGGGLTGDCTQTNDTCTGITFYTNNSYDTGMGLWCMKPDPTQSPDVLADTLRDCIAAESTVNASHFTELHTYGMFIEPDAWVAWSLDGEMILNVTSDALTAKTNPYNTTETVAARQVRGGTAPFLGGGYCHLWRGKRGSISAPGTRWASFWAHCPPMTIFDPASPRIHTKQSTN